MTERPKTMPAGSAIEDWFKPGELDAIAANADECVLCGHLMIVHALAWNRDAYHRLACGVPGCGCCP